MRGTKITNSHRYVFEIIIYIDYIFEIIIYIYIRQ